MSVEAMTADQVMSRLVVTVEPDESPLMAWELMRRAGVHHLPVVDSSCRLVGVLSREDLAAHWSGGPAEQSRIPVARLLGECSCAQVSPDTPISQVAAAMLDSGTVACVVGPDGMVTGLITPTDLVRALAGRATPGQGSADVRGGMFHLEPVLPPRTP